ncbi:hypothetical protein OFN27_28970, partial [Escherichia coli]|nr:hypothetical protein [Escherichia coli]
RVIVLISKPPSPIVARTILERAEACGKPVVVNFLGANPHDLARPNITAATTLASAANIAVALLNDQPLPTIETEISCDDLTMLQNAC